MKTILFLLASVLVASAVDVERLADAIKRQENSLKYPYGIKSIPIKGNTRAEREAYARKICVNTIRNNHRRWRSAGSRGNYIDFLADRYCPAADDPQGNANWKRNVKQFYK